MANQGHNQYTANNKKDSDSSSRSAPSRNESDSSKSAGSRSSSNDTSSSSNRSTGTQGGTHEQHVNAGKQSHKNS